MQNDQRIIIDSLSPGCLPPKLTSVYCLCVSGNMQVGEGVNFVHPYDFTGGGGEGRLPYESGSLRVIVITYLYAPFRSCGLLLLGVFKS